MKSGSAPGEKNGYWLNFGSGWSHLHNDDPAQMLTGAVSRLYYEAQAGRDSVEPSASTGPAAARQSLAPPQWKLIIEATKFVTFETVLVWSGVKAGGNDPVGVYTRVDGLDPTGTLTVEAL
ncbi:MAG: hypothetical protein HZC54_23340 [Verrucomicrobia bacterium]|nr:hypothetical protein [Verrucomicrobiota bacterium]